MTKKDDAWIKIYCYNIKYFTSKPTNPFWGKETLIKKNHTNCLSACEKPHQIKSSKQFHPLRERTFTIK